MSFPSLLSPRPLALLFSFLPTPYLPPSPPLFLIPPSFLLALPHLTPTLPLLPASFLPSSFPPSPPLSLPSSLFPPLLPPSQAYFTDYLEGHPLLVCQELLVMFLISRHRHIEALALHEKIRPLAEVSHCLFYSPVKFTSPIK